jgi:non-ribosomal peptide synthetase component F
MWRGGIVTRTAYRGTAKFDLTLSMAESADGLRAVWEYNTDLFEAATIRRLAGHFQALLEGIVANPSQRLAELSLLTAPERRQLLVAWNATQADYSQDMCVQQLFEAQVVRTPAAVAVVCEDQQLTYRELNASANQVAHYLRALGVGPEGRVSLCMERSIEMLVGLLGILKAGGAYVPLDPTYPSERLAFMLEDCQTSILLTQEQLAEKLPTRGTRVVRLDTDWEAITREGEGNPVCGVTAENLAYVIYTSGSTGRPKGVAMSHRSLSNLLSWQLQNLTIPRGARTLQFASLSFDVSFASLMNLACLFEAMISRSKTPPSKYSNGLAMVVVRKPVEPILTVLQCPLLFVTISRTPH